MSDLTKVKELRDKTHLSLADCKQALIETQGDVDQAVIWLFKTNKLKTRNVSALETKEGAVFATAFDSKAVIFELNCQTDFAAKSDDFQNLLTQIANCLCKQDHFQLNELLNQAELVLREKIFLRRSEVLTIAANSYISVYNHLGGKVAVLVRLLAETFNPAVSKLAEDLTLQIAAMNPEFVCKKDVSEDVIQAQIEIFEQQLREDLRPKPAAAWPKIIEGKLNKWYSEICLLEQESVLEPKLTVKHILERFYKENQIEIEVYDFLRYERGEKIRPTILPKEDLRVELRST